MVPEVTSRQLNVGGMRQGYQTLRRDAFCVQRLREVHQLRTLRPEALADVQGAPIGRRLSVCIAEGLRRLDLPPGLRTTQAWRWTRRGIRRQVGAGAVGRRGLVWQSSGCPRRGQAGLWLDRPRDARSGSHWLPLGHLFEGSAKPR